MTIDTIVGEDQPGDRAYRAGVMSDCIMTAHAFFGKCFYSTRRTGMHVVTGRAVHLGLNKTFAGAQQTILVAMHIQCRRICRIVFGLGEVV